MMYLLLVTCLALGLSLAATVVYAALAEFEASPMGWLLAGLPVGYALIAMVGLMRRLEADAAADATAAVVWTVVCVLMVAWVVAVIRVQGGHYD